MILYHYPISPFSEKIRLMHGFCGNKWQSLAVKSSPPRPTTIEQFISGYRRIPVAQDGADFYCDSRLIVKEFFGHLFPPQNSQQHTLSQRYEHEIFMACINSISPITLISAWHRLLTFSEFWQTTLDRMKAVKEFENFKMNRLLAKNVWHNHLSELNSNLTTDFLLGEEPSYIDFCAYHLIWFHSKITKTDLNDDFNVLSKWFQRMRAFGHGESEIITPNDALNVAKLSTPKEIFSYPKNSKLIGRSVCISPNDYFKNQTAGILVGDLEFSWTIARQNNEFGTVHVYFPKAGFELTLAS